MHSKEELYLAYLICALGIIGEMIPQHIAEELGEEWMNLAGAWLNSVHALVCPNIEKHKEEVEYIMRTANASSN
jgi:hypothetical protein